MKNEVQKIKLKEKKETKNLPKSQIVAAKLKKIDMFKKQWWYIWTIYKLIVLAAFV